MAVGDDHPAGPSPQDDLPSTTDELLAICPRLVGRIIDQRHAFLMPFHSVVSEYWSLEEWVSHSDPTWFEFDDRLSLGLANPP